MLENRTAIYYRTEITYIYNNIFGARDTESVFLVRKLYHLFIHAHVSFSR